MNLIIFGTGEQAELAHFYFKKAGHKIDFHCLDQKHISDTHFKATPIISRAELIGQNFFKSHKMHVAVGFSRLNTTRESIYVSLKSSGFSFESYVSQNANIFTQKIGENCFILEGNTIQPYSRIGNNVTIWSGNHIGHHSKIGDNVFIASHAVIAGSCNIGQNTFIGVNATIGDNVNVGMKNFVGANALILADTEDNQVFAVKATPPRKVRSSRFLKLSDEL